MNKSSKNIHLNQIIEQFGPIISRISHRMIKNKQVAEEAAQEVWCEIIKSLYSFNGDSQLSTWIYTITKRTILHYSKSEKVYTDREITTHFEKPDIDYQGSEIDKREWIKEKCDYCLTAFCHCLNTKSRLIFLFRNIANLHYSTISTIMNIKEENIRQILSRSKKKVTNFMNNNCILFNPKGNCKCRISKHIKSINLEKEYEKLTKAANLVDFYIKFDKNLPSKNYWKKLIT